MKNFLGVALAAAVTMSAFQPALADPVDMSTITCGQLATMSQEEQNRYSVRVELQADCFAGVWANYVKQQNYLEGGDVEEAINAANAIGDDTLTRGQVSERNFTHGTSAQRMAALKKGMQTGDVGQCTL